LDKQRVEQALKEIIDRCGENAVQNHSAFKSAVFDLLDEINYSDERIVFRHAMDSKAFWILLESSNITEENIKKAADQIQKESHMTKEDTEFVLQCVAGAYGEHSDSAAESTTSYQDVERKPQEEVQKNNLQPSSQGQVKTSGTGKGETIAVIIAILAVCIPSVIVFLFVFLAVLFG